MVEGLAQKMVEGLAQKTVNVAVLRLLLERARVEVYIPDLPFPDGRWQ
jgi:hypothetical protein